MEKQEIKMTAIEMARLSDWMKFKGFTTDDVDDCLHYIAGVEIPDTERKSGSPLEPNEKRT